MTGRSLFSRSAALHAVALLSAVPLACAIAGPTRSSSPPPLPAWFEPNLGQTDAGFAFVGRAKGYALALEQGGSTRVMLPFGDSYEVVRLELEGSRRASPVGEARRVSSTHLYRGEGTPELRLPHFGRVRSAGVYPGIDFLWVASGGGFQYEFHLQPFADPNQIRLRFNGAESLAISPEGDLLVGSAHGQARYARPVAFQETGSSRSDVGIAYQVAGSVATFRLDTYDSAKPLTIDPLVVSTYIGGSGFDAVNSMATDPAGNVYIAGETASTDLRSRSASSRSAFVAKLTPDVSALQYVAILSSGGNDRASAVAVDSTGNAHIAGVSGGTKFPTTANALTSVALAAPAGFVSKLGPNGQMIYSTLFGRDNTSINALALDAAGDVYIAGSTGSVSFPATAAAPQRAFAGGTDAFVAKLNLRTPSVVYATLAGGSGFDSFSGIAVNASGVACVAGSTNSVTFPVSNAVQPSYGGSQDALAGCLNPFGTGWNFLTYWGGTNPDIASAIALDSEGNPVLAGATMSWNFPAAASATAPREYDAFITKLRANGSAAIFSKLIGGAGSDAATGVAVDAGGTIWVGGYTTSTDFPQSLAVQPGYAGSMDGFLAQVTSDGAKLLLSTYLGGAGDDRILAITPKQAGIVAVGGMTSSPDFQVTPTAPQRASGGSYDGFVTVVSNRVKVDTPGVFSSGFWQMDWNANRSWDGAAIDRQMVLGQAGDTPVAGDWNGDGRTKAGIFRAGLWVLDYNGDGMWGPGDRAIVLGQAGDIPLVGDWNGDGRAKVGVFRAGLWVLDYNGDGAWGSGDWFYYFGQAGDIPLTGDWNGNSRAKSAIFRNGFWLFDYNGDGAWSAADRAVSLGQAGDIPLVGDWNGDGRAKAAIFREGLWVFDYNGDGVWGPGDRFGYMGKAGDIPLVGDWNGDGRAKAAVFSRGTWQCEMSLAGTVVTSTFGSTNAIPVVGRWQ